jgi:hypothetical protein
MERAGHLKPMLVDFALPPRFDREFWRILTRQCEDLPWASSTSQAHAARGGWRSAPMGRTQPCAALARPAAEDRASSRQPLGIMLVTCSNGGGPAGTVRTALLLVTGQAPAEARSPAEPPDLNT